MWHALLYNHVEGPFIFAKNTIRRNINLSTLNMSPFPQTAVTGKEEGKKMDKLLLLSNTLHQLDFAQKCVTTNTQMHIHMQNSHGRNNFRIAEQVTTNHMILCLKIVTPLNLSYFLWTLYSL
jgi:hypothetical protein